tara:strand:- start:8565 stop:9344 length:780 start_codon:yes stop_codon:yes gene_type:complete
MVAVTAVDARRHYFGTQMRPLAFADWLAEIGASIASGQQRRLLGHHNLHSLYLRHRDAGVAEFYRRCDECYVDGMPVLPILAAFGVPTTPAQRFSLMDCFSDLLAHAEAAQWRLYYLGSRPEVVSRAETLISQQFPALRITLCHGYHDDSEQVIADINARRPDLLLVGMGMPRQEYWLRDHLPALQVKCATPSGATLDYFAGAQAKPPAFLGRIGLAWLYRLLHDPKRLWKRYLLEPWALLPVTLRQWIRWQRGARRDT